MPFGLFNKSTKNRQSTTINNDYTSNSVNSDDRVAADGGAIVTRGNVNVLDGGAIREAFDFAERNGRDAFDTFTDLTRMNSDDVQSALFLARDVFSQAHDTVSQQADRVLTLAETAQQRDREETSVLAERALKIALPLGLAFVAAWAFRGTK